MKEKRRSDTQAGRDENDALARGGLPGAFIDSKTTGPIPSEVWSPKTAALTAASTAAPQRCTVCQVFHAPRPLPALLRVASLSSFVLKIILSPAPYSLLRATHLAPVGPIFPVVVGGILATGSLLSRRPLLDAYNAVCLRRVKASSPNAARSVQKEPSPPTDRWGREGLPWL